ncbi:MAG: hypothetical protein RI919_771 [Actinomycetota bacterium]
MNSKVDASIERSFSTLESIERGLDRIQKLDRQTSDALSRALAALKNSRGHRVLGDLERATRQCRKAINDSELLEVRASRLEYKTSRLALDLEVRNVEIPNSLGILHERNLEATQRAKHFLGALTPRLVDLQQAFTDATWFYRLDLTLNQLRAGYDTLALSDLAKYAYGPLTPPNPRRRALNELLSWGLTSGVDSLVGLASAHLSSITAVGDKAISSDRELVLRIEGLRSRGEFLHPDFFLLVSEAARRKNQDGLLATSSLMSLVKIEGLDDIAIKLQVDWLNAALAQNELEPLFLNEAYAHKSLLDQVDCHVDEEEFINNGELVSVIVPLFNAEEWIETALRSLAAQTWRNLEVIVVDDCSTDNSLVAARKFAAKDPRFKIIASDQNRGAYGCRNLGMEIATGHFITVHDADDWSHPRKIQLQIEHLRANPSTVANMSQCARIEEDLTFFAQFGREILRQNSSALLFAKETVFSKLGYWDEVKFGADTEYHHRIQATFGADSAPIARLGLLSLTRYHSASLTGGGKNTTVRGIVGARRDYVRKFTDWHKANSDVENGLFLERGVTERPFPIPVASANGEENIDDFDLVVIGDLETESAWLDHLLQNVTEASGRGDSVALIHLPALENPWGQPAEQVEALLTAGYATRLNRENVAFAKQLLMHAGSLRAKNELLPELRVGEVQILLDETSVGLDLAAATQLASNYFGQEPKLIAFNAEVSEQLEVVGHKPHTTWVS